MRVRAFHLNSNACHAPASPGGASPGKPHDGTLKLLSAKEAAKRLRKSVSWLAKSRMKGAGPPFLKTGRSIDYNEADILRWLKSRKRRSTSEK
jgi:predicted DNA-binding transcriptional regulator AlpA